MTTSVLIIGIAPELANLDNFPGLTVEKLKADLAASKAGLQALGYEVEQCFIPPDAHGAEAIVKPLLESRTFDVALIGAGVRIPPQHLLLFERLINLLHTHAREARICFNSLPSDTQAAIERMI